MSDCWYSVTVEEEGKVVFREIRRLAREQTFRDVFMGLWPSSNTADIDMELCKVQVSELRDGRDRHSVELGAPAVQIMEMFGTKFIRFQLTKLCQVELHNPRRSIADVLMQSAREYRSYPDPRAERGSGKVFNTLLAILRDKQVGFKPDQLDFARNILDKLANAAWFIDPHLPKRGLSIPGYFHPLTGFNDPVSHKRAIPKIDSSELKSHIDSVSELLMSTWIGRFPEFLHATQGFVETLNGYHGYLVDHQKRTKKHHANPEPLRSPDNNFILRTVKGNQQEFEDGGPYSDLWNATTNTECYQPLSLLSFEPGDRYQRRHWLDKLVLPHSIQLYSYCQGNSLGNLNFIWKVPDDGQRDEGEILRTITGLHRTMRTYSTRAMRREFYDRYEAKASVSPVVLRDMYRYLTEDSSAPESSQQKDMDTRFMKMIAELDEPQIMVDLRQKGGRSGMTKFDLFWEETDKYFNEIVPAVQERRHGEQLYLPAALSTEDLRDRIKSRLPPNTPIPSAERVRLQFWPKNPTTERAMQHTGRFNIKFAVQQRLLRSQHEDDKYCLYLYRMVKTFAVRYRGESKLLYLDDKAVVPVGEPEKPVSTGVRGHNSSITQKDGPQLKALDHDFHLCGIIPSVAFVSEIPENPRDTFFTGLGCLTLKDKIFQPSSPMRHATEVINMLRSLYSDDGVNLNTPILLNYTDGGPDHRTTYGSVQVAGIVMFVALDLDMFVTARTWPGGSYANLADRYNSLLNLALQNVSTARAPMSEEMEKVMKRCNTIGEVRKKSEQFSGLKEGLLASVEPLHDQLKHCFERVKLKGVPVQVHQPATEEDIQDKFSLIHLIADSLDPDKLTQPDLKKSVKLQDFMDRHCRLRHYIFQVKKCSENPCWYCTLNPPRLQNFDEVSFVPDPVLDRNGDLYLPFDAVYGKPTSDKDRPSLKTAMADKSEADQRNKSLLCGTKVRGIITCGECQKPRCIYAASMLKQDEQVLVQRVCDEATYVCGSNLFPPSSPQYPAIFVREDNRCSKPIEVTYYARKTAAFPDVCSHCGSRNSLVDLQELKRRFSIVRPICIVCQTAGKEPATRGEKNVGRKK